MKKNMKVRWHLTEVSMLAVGQDGYGTTITDEDETGHVLVSVESAGALHFTIWCAVTWLTPA